MGFLSKGASMLDAVSAAEVIWPCEMVGMFVQKDAGAVKSVFVELTNIHPQPEEHHTVDPVQVISLFQHIVEKMKWTMPDVRGSALQRTLDPQPGQARIVSFIHSHPGGSWEPSRADYSGLRAMEWLGIHRAWILAPDTAGFDSLPELLPNGAKLASGCSWARGSITLYDANGLIEKREGAF